MYRVLFLKIKGICFVEVSYRDFFYSVSLLIVSVIYTICLIAWIGLLTHSVLISIAQVYLFQKNWQYFDNKASTLFGRTSAGIVLCFVGGCLTLSVFYLWVCTLHYLSYSSWLGGFHCICSASRNLYTIWGKVRLWNVLKFTFFQKIKSS